MNINEIEIVYSNLLAAFYRDTGARHMDKKAEMVINTLWLLPRELFIYFITHRYFEAADCVIENRIFEKDADGNTPMHIAMVHNIEYAAHLMSSESDLEVLNFNDETPIQYALRVSPDLEYDILEYFGEFALV